MSKQHTYYLRLRQASWFALMAVLLYPQASHGMYDPHHGRWFQRDPHGVEIDAPKAAARVLDQVQDGMNLYEYVRGGPVSRTDWNGKFATQSGDLQPASPTRNGCCILEYRSSLVGVATHLGLQVDARRCPHINKTFNVQFGPEFFPLPFGKIKSYPQWTSPNHEATDKTTCEKCICLLKLHTRVYKNDPLGYVLVGPNSNSALYDTVSDCGLSLPKLKTPLVFFWGLTTDPGRDDNGR